MSSAWDMQAVEEDRVAPQHSAIISSVAYVGSGTAPGGRRFRAEFMVFLTGWLVRMRCGVLRSTRSRSAAYSNVLAGAKLESFVDSPCSAISCDLLHTHAY